MLTVDPQSTTALDDLVAGLSTFEERLDDWRPVWPSVAAVFYARMAQAFATQGGGKWSALSEKYARWKTRHFAGASLLVRSGALMTSLVGAEAPGAIYRANARRLELGTSVKYAKPVAKMRSLGIPVSAMARVGLQEFVRGAWERRRADMPGLMAAS